MLLIKQICHMSYSVEYSYSNRIFLSIVSHCVPVSIVLLPIHPILKCHVWLKVGSFLHILHELGVLRLWILGFLIISVIASPVSSFLSESLSTSLHFKSFLLFFSLCHFRNTFTLTLALDLSSSQLFELFDLIQSLPVESHVWAKVLALRFDIFAVIMLSCGRRYTFISRLVLVSFISSMSSLAPTAFTTVGSWVGSRSRSPSPRLVLPIMPTARPLMPVVAIIVLICTWPFWWWTAMPSTAMLTLRGRATSSSMMLFAFVPLSFLVLFMLFILLLRFFGTVLQLLYFFLDLF